MRTWRMGLTTAAYLTLLAGLVMASQAEAAGFGVRVVDEFGKPLSGAAVCVGTEGKVDQFGRYVTSVDGDIMIEDLPQVPLSVTVSKQSYQGVQFFEPVRNWNLIKQVTLLLDGEGPTCSDTGMVLEENDRRSLTIGHLQVSGNSGNYTIDSEISGDPSHYRVSDRRDFKGATWKPYSK
ncbi:MAG: hypothetical protein KDJ38_09265, partial [Gammaproteobacteria bacterium]|nr:hypothetical protein [Gammaproteobacteria bacterium]